MAGRIYLVNDEAKLVAMEETPYDSERLLQELLENYADLLAGEQINSDDPRRWALVTREMSVPGEEAGAGRWSLDHLFLDQDAIPTLVEVKRSTDTRIRREVVGQMLDYAANAVSYWPVEEIRARFEATWQTRGLEPADVLAALTEDDDLAAGDFWQKVKTNLQAGRIRLVFVADTIPAELRRVIEFLNEQMDPAEVIGVEIRQFVGQGLKTLAPRVVGQTETAQRKKQPTSKREAIGEEEFWRLFRSARPEGEVKAAEHLVQWSKKVGLRDGFTQGPAGAVFMPVFQFGASSLLPFAMSPRGTFHLHMRWLKNYAPFDTETVREEVRRRCERFDGFTLTAKGMEGVPKIPLAALDGETALNDLCNTLDWIIEQLRAHGHEASET